MINLSVLTNSLLEHTQDTGDAGSKSAGVESETRQKCDSLTAIESDNCIYCVMWRLNTESMSTLSHEMQKKTGIRRRCYLPQGSLPCVILSSLGFLWPETEILGMKCCKMKTWTLAYCHGSDHHLRASPSCRPFTDCTLSVYLSVCGPFLSHCMLLHSFAKWRDVWIVI